MTPSTAVLPEVTASASSAKHNSFLKRLGHLGLECVTKVLPFLTREAQRCEPLVDLLFPLEGAMFTSVVNSVCLAEAAGAKAGEGATGELKFKAVWNAAAPQLLKLAADHGITPEDAEAHATKYIEAIITILNGPVKEPAAAKASS